MIRCELNRDDGAGVVAQIEDVEASQGIDATLQGGRFVMAVSIVLQLSGGSRLSPRRTCEEPADPVPRAHGEPAYNMKVPPASIPPIV